MTRMYCPKCYRQNDDSRTTCIKCGAKLRKPLISKENAGKAFNAIKSDVDKRVAKKAAQDEIIKNLGESWKKTFKGSLLTPAWSLTDKGIIFKNEVYGFSLRLQMWLKVLCLLRGSPAARFRCLSAEKPRL